MAGVAGLALLLGDGDGQAGGGAAPGRAGAGPDAPVVPLEPPARGPGDPTTPAPAPAGGAAHASVDDGPGLDLGHDEIRARLAAGEPGMELLAARLPEHGQPAPLTPRWEVGDEWVVETWYRQVQAHADEWIGPAVWRFRVEREVGFRDEPCLELTVTRADEPQVPPVTLWIARAGHLAGVETTVTQQGKAQRALHVIPRGDAPEALRAPLTSAPVRLPPPGALARLAPAGLPFDPLGAAPPDVAEHLRSGDPTLDIEFRDPLDGTTVRQRWAQGDLRWPVVSRTETTLSLRR
ncbi:MAG: hypothetical protein M9894_17990 [Planctomycetes bacterium]|nr:hypothetical protein [Planctomycetota bacterium]